MDLFKFILFETLHSLDLDVHFHFPVREVFGYYFIKKVLCPFLSLFSFWDPYDVNVSMPVVVPELS